MRFQHKIQTFLTKGFWSGIWYAIREIALIVIGVLLAIWFTNLNDARKDKDLEIKTLRALSAGLRQDSSDIEGNIRALKEISGRRKKAMQIFEGKMPLDSLDGGSFISSYVVFLNNIAPYENLKSVGLDKITNDSLRTQIITLFELDYRNFIRMEQQINDSKSEKLNRYSEMGLYHFYQKKSFAAFVQLLAKDKNFVFENFIAAQKEDMLRNRYLELQPKLNRLIRNVERECKK